MADKIAQIICKKRNFEMRISIWPVYGLFTRLDFKSCIPQLLNCCTDQLELSLKDGYVLKQQVSVTFNLVFFVLKGCP